MSTLEEVSRQCISVSEVFNEIPIEAISECVAKHTGGRKSRRWEEIPGIEPDPNNTRYVLLLDSEECAEKFLQNFEQEEIDYNGKSYTVSYIRTIACEVPIDWREDSDDDLEVDGDPDPSDDHSGKPQVPQRPPLQALSQQSEMPLASGIYANYPPRDQSPRGQQSHQQPQPMVPQYFFQDPRNGQVIHGFFDPSNGQVFFFGQSGEKITIVSDRAQNPVYLDANTHQYVQLQMLTYNPAQYPQPIYDVPTSARMAYDSPPPPYTSPDQSAQFTPTDPPRGSRIAQDQQEIYQALQRKQNEEDSRAASDEAASGFSTVPVVMPAADSDYTYYSARESVCTTATHVKVTNIPESVYEDYLVTTFQTATNLPVKVVRWDNGVAILDVQTSEAASKILQSPPFRVKDQEMQVEEYFPEEEENKSDTSTVQIIGKITRDQVEMYFENKRRSGGGAIKVTQEIEQGVFWVTFESEEAVQRVLNRVHKIGTEELEVCLYADIAPQPEAGDNTAETGPLCTIVVRGVSCIQSMDLLEMYFESKKKSGGGEIQELKKDERDVDVLYITYEEEEVARRVASRSHTVDGRKLQVMLLEPIADDTGEDEIDAEPRCTVMVKGVSQISSRDVLEMHFENKKRSGGDEFEEIKTDEEDNDVVYITYAEETVAQAVASRQHVIDNQTLEVSLYIPPKVPSEPVGPVKTVRVQLQTPVSTDVLEMYFESKKRSDGGDVECVDIDPDDASVAYVTFEEEDVAERVASKSHMIDGSQVEVSLQPPQGQQHVAACTTIKVTGARHFKTTDSLELYFESRKRSGGGNIVEIKRDEENEDFVYITYESEDVVKSVLQRSRHRVNDLNLKVEAFIPGKQSRKTLSQKTHNEKEEEEEAPICTVKVSGFKSLGSTDSWIYYFENKRRSGGGEIVKNWADSENPDIRYITFTCEAVAKAVAERSPHKVNNQELKAVLYRPPKPLPSYTDRILIKGLNPATTQDCLFNYLEAKIQAVPVKLNYGAVEGVVMVTFQEDPDVAKLETINGKVLEKSTLTISQVTISNCVYVTNLSEKTSKDTLTYYFENKRRSSGGEVDKIVMVPDDNAALVYFMDYNTVNDVLAQQTHTVEGQLLNVKLYVECLGCTDGDGSEPAFKIPNPVFLKNLNQQKIRFLQNSPVHKKAMETQLAECQANIHWQADKPEVQLECTLSKDMKDCRKLAKTWKKTAEDNFKDFFDKIKVRNISATQTTWESVIKQVQTLSIPNSESLAVMVDKEQHLFRVVGIGPTVAEVADKIQACIKSVDEEEERMKSIVKETATLKPIQTKMLLADKFPNKIKDTYPNLKVVITQNRNEVAFEGTHADVRNAKMKMHESVNDFAQETLQDLPKVGASLYSERAVKEYIVKVLKSQKLVAVWELSQDNTKLTVCSPSEDKVNACLEMVKDAVKEQQFPLTKDSRNVVQGQAWDNQVDQWKNQFPGRVLINVVDLDKVYVCATDDIMDQLVPMVQGFINKNTIVSETLNLSNSVVQFIEKHEKEAVDRISKNLISQNLQISCRKGNAGYTIRGTEEGVASAKRDLFALASMVKKEEHTIKKPGIGMHMQTSKGLQTLSQVEQTHPVVIRQKGSDEEDGSDEEYAFMDSGGMSSQSAAASDTGLALHAMCKAYDDSKVYAAEGDLTEANVDVLVNTADEKLSLNGGLGRAIVKKGGKSIEKQCQQYIGAQGKLAEGETFVSSAGNLKAKHVVHVVGPKWHGGQANEEEILEEAVMKALQQASAKNARSIAVPAVSCGVLGYPVKQATNIIVKAVKNFFKEFQDDTTIKEVYLCDIKTEYVERFATALGVVFGPHNVTLMTREERRKKPPSRGVSMPSDGRQDKQFPGGVPPSLPPRRASGGSQDSVQIGNINVTVVKGEIAKQKVDVIVNTTARNLDLKNGAVSTSLSNAAGSGMQKEANQKYPKGIASGELAQTRGHKLQCHMVLHGTLMNWDGGAQATSALHHLVTSSLKEADQQGFGSIAMPAIGTGNLGFPRDVVAKEMFKMVARFDQKNAGSSIQDVRFIVYQKDLETIKAFEREAASWSRGGSREPSGPSRRFATNYEDTISEGDEGQEEEAIYESIDDVLPDKPWSVFNMDSSDIQVSVRKADLTEEQCDCIVNSSNAELDLTKGAVAKALLAKGGNELKKEAESKSKLMARHQLVVTSAPGLKCKNIIHMVAQDSASSWKTLVDKVLIEAEKQRFTSIAFPALGTGLQMKAKDIARVMFQAIQDFKKSQPVNLKDIRFVIFQQSMVDDFCSAIEGETGKKPKKGKLGAIWDSFKAKVGGTNRNSAGGAKDTGKGKAAMSGTMITDEITVIVYAKDSRAIKEAVKMLTDLLEKETMRKEFSDSIVMRMDRNTVTEIKALERQHHVKIDITSSKGKIVITGLPQHVLNVSDKVYSHMRAIEQQESMKEKANLLSNIVQWYYIEVSETGRNLESYEATVNHLIENAFQQQDQTVRFKDKDGIRYEIDFNNMVEYEVDNKQDTVSVIRRDLLKEGTFEPPSTWKQMSSNFMVVQLQSTDAEYKQVHSVFIQSAQQQFNVTRIDRIQNKTLWQQYQAKKKQLESQNKPGTQNERLLWHGTAVEGVDSINTHGFNRSYCGKNATAFGDGVYFAVNANYSCQTTYSRPDPSGVQHIYYSRVLTGDYTLGTHGMRVPPQKQQGSHDLFDSVVNNKASPAMFIIFNDTQAYPEYLIRFKR